MNPNRFFQCFIALAFGLTLSNSAMGYIDGGTGSLLLQATISGLLGAVFVFRSFFKGLASRFQRKASTSAEPLEEERKAA